jgi:hypothetical protein
MLRAGYHKVEPLSATSPHGGAWGYDGEQSYPPRK